MYLVFNREIINISVVNGTNILQSHHSWPTMKQVRITSRPIINITIINEYRTITFLTCDTSKNNKPKKKLIHVA
jgi:hypothetical protein